MRVSPSLTVFHKKNNLTRYGGAQTWEAEAGGLSHAQIHTESDSSLGYIKPTWATSNAPSLPKLYCSFCRDSSRHSLFLLTSGLANCDKAQA